jgi:5-methylcytosine-specific restriction endonuclease McrA
VIKPLAVVTPRVEKPAEDLFKSPACEPQRELPCSKVVEQDTQATSSGGPSKSLENIQKRYQFKFTGSQETYRNYQEAAGLLSGKYKGVPSIDDVFAEALEAFLDKHSPRRRAKRRAMKKERKAEKPGGGFMTGNNSRYIPVEVRDEVWERDEGRCAFIGEDGKRCGSQIGLQVDHVYPFGLGGSSNDSANLRLCCIQHNRYAAEQIYGKEYMERKICGGT